MKLVSILINEDLLFAQTAFERAEAGDVVELAGIYLGLLKAYRDQLRTLGGMPQLDYAMRSAIAKELVEQSRNAVRSAIETTTSERNRVEALLESFTLITGWEAAITLNELRYGNADDWELIGSDVRSPSTNEHLTVQEAVVVAGDLRRKAYTSRKPSIAPTEP
jgi:hypothetical protein